MRDGDKSGGQIAMAYFARLVRSGSQRGQGLVKYALLLAVVGLTGAVALTATGTSLKEAYDDVLTALRGDTSIGVMAAVISAFLTNLLNRRFFRDQLAEQRYAEVYLDKMLDLWGDVSDIYLDFIHVLGEIANLEELSRESPMSEIRSEQERILREKLPPISFRAAALDRYYYLFTPRQADALKDFQRMLTASWESLTPAQSGHFLKTLGEKYSNLIYEMRHLQAELHSRKKKASDIFTSEINVIPPYVDKALSSIEGGEQ